MNKANFSLQENLLQEEPSYSIFFCSMNCGNPIVLGVDAIYHESISNERFSKWLTCGGESLLNISNLRTMKDKSEIWEIAENYRQRYCDMTQKTELTAGSNSWYGIRVPSIS